MIEINSNQVITAVIIFFLTVGLTTVITMIIQNSKTKTKNAQKKFNELESEIKSIKENDLKRFQKIYEQATNKYNELENEIKNIKGNYLNRFQKIYEQATMNNEKIMNGLNEIKLLIEREFVRKKDLEEIKRNQE